MMLRGQGEFVQCGGHVGIPGGVKERGEVIFNSWFGFFPWGEVSGWVGIGGGKREWGWKVGREVSIGVALSCLCDGIVGGEGGWATWEVSRDFWERG